MLDELRKIVGEPRTVRDKAEIRRILAEIERCTGDNMHDMLAILDELSEVAMIVHKNGIRVVGDHVENRKGRDSLSFDYMIAKVTKAMEVPLSARVSTEAMAASAELFCHLAKPGDKSAEREEISVLLQLGDTLTTAKTKERERFEKLNKRLEKYGVDLVKTCVLIGLFVKAQHHDVAQKLAGELAHLGAKVVAVCLDVQDDVKERRREAAKRLDDEIAAMSDI